MTHPLPLRMATNSPSETVPALLDSSLDWGAHCSYFYETTGALLSLVVPYLHQGLLTNERCIWLISDPLDIERAREALERVAGDLTGFLDRDQLVLGDAKSWYIPDGLLDPAESLERWNNAILDAGQRGFRGLRVAGDPSWVSSSDWSAFSEMESRFNEKVHQLPVKALCTYSLERCRARQLVDVIRGHQTAFIQSEGVWTTLESSVQREARETEAERTQRLRQQAALTETLARQAEDLVRYNQELEQFAYVSSHDLKEPLRKIATFSQILQERYRGRLDKEADRFINHISESVGRMNGLIDGLLAYSRIGHHAAPITATTDLKPVLEDALSDLSAVLAERRAQLVVGELPTVRVDPVQLRQVFQNLIGNALKFCRNRTPRVEVFAEATEDEWLIGVRDNGIGIDRKYWQQIFKVFHRLHTRADFPGSGIGLAICKRIIERHGGEIWVYSEPSAGSTFFFTLPR